MLPARVGQLAHPIPFPADDLRGRSVHMLGIGGAGMSALARLLASYAGTSRVSGCDAVATPVTEALIGEGIEVGFDDRVPSLPDDCEMVVASAAIRADHPRVLEAQRLGLPVLTYAEALGRVMRPATGIAIAGTHGKSTTSAMLGATLARVGLDPSVIVGANVPDFARESGGGGFRLGAPSVPVGSMRGQPGFLIVEACEFNRSFHNLRPRIAAITGVEADHLDVYGSLDAVIEAFREFATLLPGAGESGKLLIGHENAHRRDVTRGLDCHVETIGFSPESDWSIVVRGREVELLKHGSPLCAFEPPMPGEHNARNAATAVALSVMVGADPAGAADAVAAFGGVERRFQNLGTRDLGSGSVRVYDDYGHHPTEVDATIRAVRRHERIDDAEGRLICVFQPHQHSRTRFLMDEFASAFEGADLVLVPEIYFVRDSEAEKQRVSSADLVQRLTERGVEARHLHPFEKIVRELESEARGGDVVLVMGAGPVWQIGHAFAGLRSGAVGA